VVFGEIYLTGYETNTFFPRYSTNMDPPAEEIAILCRKAKEHDLYVIMGMLTRTTGWTNDLYDTTILVGPEGLIGAYHATTTSTAVVDALRVLKISKVDVCAPYADELTSKISIFLNGNGIRVCNVKGMGIRDGSECDVPPHRIIDFAVRTKSEDSDGLFISCTNFPASAVIQHLEETLGKPVITANQATIWKAARLCGSRQAVKGFGRLLSET